MKISYFFLFVLFLLCHSISFAQNQDSIPDTEHRGFIYDLKFTGYPLLGFLPETSWSFGGGGVGTWRFKNSSPTSKASTTSLLALYTLKKQWIFLMPYDWQFNNNKQRLQGEVGYFDYFFNFFGFGTEVQDENLETYTSNLFRLIANYDHNISGPHYVGLAYNIDYFFNPGYDPDGLIESERPLGYDMGIRSGLGLRYRFDTRDNYLYPSKGVFVTLEGMVNNRLIGSDYDCSRVLLFANFYQSITKNQFLALNVSAASYSQNTPYFELPYLSKPIYMRGYADRKFMDNNLLVFRMEYRFPIFWRFRGTLFSSYGSVSDKFQDIFDTRWRWSYGVGLRFVLNPKEKLNIRLDYGIGHKEDTNFYLTIGEVF